MTKKLLAGQFAPSPTKNTGANTFKGVNKPESDGVASSWVSLWSIKWAHRFLKDYINFRESEGILRLAAGYRKEYYPIHVKYKVVDTGHSWDVVIEKEDVPVIKFYITIMKKDFEEVDRVFFKILEDGQSRKLNDTEVAILFIARFFSMEDLDEKNCRCFKILEKFSAESNDPKGNITDDLLHTLFAAFEKGVPGRYKPLSFGGSISSNFPDPNDPGFEWFGEE